MNQKEQIPRPDESFDEIDMDAMSSVDDFIKELEAKEKDLHITSDMTIEIEESDFGMPSLQDFVESELAAEATPALASPRPQMSPANSQGAKTRIYELEQEIVKLNERISGLRSDRLEIQEKSDRRLKDFENYKYRMDRERRGSFIDQISNLASQMLPVLDNLDRALNAADRLTGEKGPEFQQFYDGIVLVNQQVNEVFAGMGVTPIATVGETFDPNFHEAVAVEENEDMPNNTVTEEMLRGYRIGNRVIRHSMVKVTSQPKPSRFDRPSTADELPPAIEIADPADADGDTSSPEV
ncbi:MAG: nucleotide exchange factor GrpE [Pyrinomonadaceae bacterium]|nr:nucleotide exchange factor GrpE [Pyrinomonadaceae bacterium]